MFTSDFLFKPLQFLYEQVSLQALIADCATVFVLTYYLQLEFIIVKLYKFTTIFLLIQNEVWWLKFNSELNMHTVQ